MDNNQLIDNIKQQRLISVGALFKESWNFYRSRFATLTGIIAVPTIIAIVGAILLSYGKSSLASGPVLAGMIIIGVAGIIYVVSYLALVYAIVKSVGIKESYNLAVHNIFRYLWIFVLTLLITLGGFIMGVVPGITFSIWFMFSIYVLATENQYGLSALLKSKEYIRGYWWQVLGRSLVVWLAIYGVIIAFQLLTSLIIKSVGNISDYVIQVLAFPLAAVYSYLIFKHLAEIKPEYKQARKFINLLMASI